MSAGLSALLAFAVGCESAQTDRSPQQPLAPVVTNAELFRISKFEFQDCIASFYVDDWVKVGELAGRMAELAERWKSQTPPAGKDADFQEQSAGFGKAVEELRAAAGDRDVGEAEQALRLMARHLAALETLVKS